MAAVMASISAWAVTSPSVSVMLCPRPMTLPLATTTAPMGISSACIAARASSSAMFMKRMSVSSCVMACCYEMSMVRPSLAAMVLGKMRWASLRWALSSW